MYNYKYPHPAVTADCLVFTKKQEETFILLIQRKNEPFKDKWAFPGGFMNIDETTQEAACRELWEETELKVENVHQIGVFDSVQRDPRERVITVAYYTLLEEVVEVNAKDDAKKAQWFSLKALPELAFDHKEILKRALISLEK